MKHACSFTVFHASATKITISSYIRSYLLIYSVVLDQEPSNEFLRFFLLMHNNLNNPIFNFGWGRNLVETKA